jgi:hypothetical protein
MMALRKIGTKSAPAGGAFSDSVDRGGRVDPALPTRVGPRARVPLKVAGGVEGS